MNRTRPGRDHESGGVTAWAATFVLALSLAGCRGDSPPEATREEFAIEAIEAPTAWSASELRARGAAINALTADPAQSRERFIRNAEVTLEVEDVDSATARVRSIMEEVGGRIERSASSSPRGQGVRVQQFMLRVPEERLDEGIERVRGLGEEENVTINAREVSEQLIDLEVRLRNARRLEDRLLTILDERAGELADVLNVERELARVRGEVERFDAQLRGLGHDVAWSTLGVNLHEPYPLASKHGMGAGARLVRAFGRAADNFVGFVAGAIAALGYILPLAVLATAGYAAVRWQQRRRQNANP